MYIKKTLIILSTLFFATCDKTTTGPDFFGCTDEQAINFNPTVTISDDSCLYSFGDDGTHHDICNTILYTNEIILEFGAFDPVNRQLEILYNSTSEISSFEFNVSGLTLIGSSNGIVDANYFEVSIFDETVYGSSFSGNLIPPSCGVLTVLSFSEIVNDSTELYDVFFIDSTDEFINSSAEGFIDHSNSIDCNGEYYDYGNYILNECDACVMDGNIANACHLPTNNIYLFNNEDTGLTEVWYNINADIGSFQFQSDVTIYDMFGGVAEDYGFIQNNTEDYGLGFTFYPENPIPLGCGVLTYLSLSSVARSLSVMKVSTYCMSELSESPGSVIDCLPV